MPIPSLPLSFLGVQLARLFRLILTVQNPKKSWLATKPACSLVDDASLGPRLPPSSPGCPRSLSLAGDGPVRNLLPLLSPLFCEQTCWYLSLGVFTGVAILGPGLLFHVSSLRLPWGHSGLVLTLNNAACTFLPSPLLLGTDAGVCAASPLGVTIGHVICGFTFFIYFSSYLCCPLRFQGLPQTRQ